ncbi:MAG: SBBP repeat-containing protein [Acidobacteria bacterium]|nr:SBBP repeat-containing protein [Acidobacteriota bacterium]MBI3655756.1 SBBP repeat-containing protein [Acidobacteriota bacterium]
MLFASDRHGSLSLSVVGVCKANATASTQAYSIRRAAMNLLVVFVITALFCAPGFSAKKKKGPEVAKPVNLVWPPPPEKPRIRYIKSLSSNEDIEPPKKKGWLAKLINEEDARRVIGMLRPAGMATDSKGRLYVADTNRAVVFVFDQENKKLSFIGSEGQGRLSGPFGIAIDKNDTVYVSDTRLKKVNIYSSDGVLTNAISRISGQELVNPAGLALDEPNGRLYIADTRGHQVFACDLKNLGNGARFGKRGEGDDEFNFPTAIAVDKSGNIYVTDTMNFSVKLFDKNFKFIRKLGKEHGLGIGSFDRPKGIAIDSEGNIYVVDATFSNFQIFNSSGKLLLFIGSFGSEPGGFRLPSSIFIDKKDQIYVSDQANRRVDMFQFLGGN